MDCHVLGVRKVPSFALNHSLEHVVCNPQTRSRCLVTVRENHLFYQVRFMGAQGWVRQARQSACSYRAGWSWHMSSMVYRWNKGGSEKLWKFLSLCNKWFGYYSEFTDLPVMQFCLLFLHTYVHVLCIYIYSGTQFALLKWWYSEWIYDLNLKGSHSFNKYLLSANYVPALL